MLIKKYLRCWYFW